MAAIRLVSTCEARETATAQILAALGGCRAELSRSGSNRLKYAGYKQCGRCQRLLQTHLVMLQPHRVYMREQDTPDNTRCDVHSRCRLMISSERVGQEPSNISMHVSVFQCWMAMSQAQDCESLGSTAGHLPKR